MRELPKRIIGGGGLPRSARDREFMNLHKIEVIDTTGASTDDFNHYMIEFDKEQDPADMTNGDVIRAALQRRIDAFKRMNRPQFEVDALQYEFDRRYRDDFVNDIYESLNVKTGPLKLEDGSTVNVSVEDAKLIKKFAASGGDSKKIQNELVKSKKDFKDVLEFIKAAS